MAAVSIDEQLTAVRGDRLRVLVVGAGVAGSVVARLLQKLGLHPVVIERAACDADAGYMFGLLPLVNPVLRRLDALETFVRRSLSANRYLIRDRRAQPLREYDLDQLFGHHGGYRWIERADFLDVVTAGELSVTYQTTVTAIEQTDQHVRVALTNIGTDDVPAKTVDDQFDVVVGADGMHSTVRALMTGADRVSGFDNGVGGWLGWCEHQLSPVRVDEVWGAGLFIASYPSPAKTGVFVAGIRKEMTSGPKEFVANIRTRLPHIPAPVSETLDAVTDGPNYLWHMEDRRAANWTDGRVVLVGDAAVGFLPTAGIGAAMAVESAGVLAATLGNSRRDTVAGDILRYEQHQRPRSITAQQNSRLLARMMFTRNDALAAVRDFATRLTPAAVATRDIRRLLDNAPSGVPV